MAWRTHVIGRLDGQPHDTYGVGPLARTECAGHPRFGLDNMSYMT